MKSEYFNHPTKGLCILISEINPIEFLRSTGDENKLGLPPECLIFKNIDRIAEEIINDRFIACIKEIRTQTGWGLKEAKDYAEKYMRGIYFNDLETGAKQFIKEHTMPKFTELINDDDFIMD